MNCPCGLVTLKQEPVPLKSIAVSVSILEFVADVSATLNYENEEAVPVEAFFVFPMDEDSAVYSFEALVNGRTIVAELRDKEKAHSEYEDALSQGHQAFLLEEDTLSGDIFCCSVGNLPPGSRAALTLKYVRELAVEADGALRYVLPAVLNPRYQLSGSLDNSLLSMQCPKDPERPLPYTLSLAASVRSQHTIDRIQSNCSLNAIKYLGNDRTSAEVSLADGHKFDRDVELLIYYQEVHTPNVTVEMGEPNAKPDSLMGAPSAMMSFYPDIPKTQPSKACGEFVFLMDRSGSMDCPMNKDSPQSRIEAAKETLILLLKSLPLGCYFNIHGFGSSYETFFNKSVEYTQKTMEEALNRVKLLKANLGGTEILNPLQIIYQAPSIPDHPLQLFVFTDGEVTDTSRVIEEVRKNSPKHRCFSFGIGEGASTSLIKGIARASGGAAEFITGKDRMQSKALRSLKRALQPTVEGVSLSWDLPSGLSAQLLSPPETSVFQGQRLIIYAQLLGTMPSAEVTGKVCFKYTFQGKSVENKVTFPLQSQLDPNFTVHRLAAKAFIQAKDMGRWGTDEADVKTIVQASLECGVMSSHTAFIAIDKALNQPVQGPLAQRNIPTSMLFQCPTPLSYSPGPMLCLSVPLSKPRLGIFKKLRKSRLASMGIRTCSSSTITPHVQASERFSDPEDVVFCLGSNPSKDESEAQELEDAQVPETDQLLKLIILQRANGCWELDDQLATILGVNLPDMMAALTVKDVEPSCWATVLAVTWLHTNGQGRKCEWELLERKAVAWIHNHTGCVLQTLVEAAAAFLKSSVDVAVFAL
ncbi:von Willebrand factor A domain-containing protein 5A-like [Sorex fumeus]|uniref:von Willebrand factor A domain-containing protein 5A-like n=1 Tax=Sorex fumeus TaxID=62283 RepID=UPI0024AE6AEC|nr:von Willebrand factor A domain-containing protein 5A-like [Sorex fumeus]